MLTGWQEPSALPALVAAADVALFPADDNLANRAKCSVKLLQCLWLGLPVVADRVGQLAEYVQDGVSGLLADPERPESMAAAATRLLLDPSLAARLGAGGRRRAEESFDWNRLAPLAERAYGAALRETQEQQRPFFLRGRDRWRSPSGRARRHARPPSGGRAAFEGE